MSTWPCFFAALAIEPGLQRLDGGAGQHQGVVVEDVVDVRSDRRQEVDLAKVAGRLGEADVERVAVDHQGVAAEVEAGQPLPERLGLGSVEIEILEDDEPAVTRLRRERHPQAERPDLLVQRRVEIADAGAVGLAAADEDRRAPIAVAGGAAALLAAVFLAGAGDVGALACAAGGAAALLELPGDDSVEDVGAGLDTENLVGELDVLARLAAVQGLNFDLHGLAFLAFGGFRSRGGFSRRLSGSVVFVLGGGAEARRIGRRFRARRLDRVLDEQPAALVAGHGALHEEEAALDVGADDLEILLGAVLRAHMAGHLLVLEDPARILALAGRAERAVRERDAVGGAQTAEAPALHSALEALALGRALDVDELAGDIMVGGDLSADVEQGVLGDDELGDARLRLHLGLAEMAALRLGDVLRLGGAGAELDRDIAVVVRVLARDHLDIFERQDG